MDMRKGILAGFSALILSTAANATPIEWTLNDVVFDDGTAVTGSFVYDADTNSWLAWSISVLDGTLSAFTYENSSSQTNGANRSGMGFMFVETGYSRYINLNFDGLMTDAGGTLWLELRDVFNGGFNRGSWECGNCQPVRWIAGGSVSSVPEPGTLLLLGAGLLGIGARRRMIARASA